MDPSGSGLAEIVEDPNNKNETSINRETGQNKYDEED